MKTLHLVIAGLLTLALMPCMSSAQQFSSPQYGGVKFRGATNSDPSNQTILKALPGATGTLTLPAATDILVGQNTFDTLTNKVLTSPTINGTLIINGFTFPGSPVICSTSTCSPALNSGDLLLTGTATQTVSLPVASTRLMPITIKDYGCNSSSFGKTILPNGSDTVDQTYTSSNGGVGLYANCASLTLFPRSGGWYIQ